MARSYRKPYFTSSGSNYRAYMKRLANKRVRRSFAVPDGKAFKKFSCSYDIDDFGWYLGHESDWGKKSARK